MDDELKQAEEIRRDGIITNAAAGIDEHVDRLHHQLSRLEEALTPVLHPAYPAPVGPDHDPAIQPQSSPLGAQLGSFRDRVSAASDRVITILERLDLTT